MYQTTDGKWKAVTDNIVQIYETQQPLLIGTTSIEDSEYLSERLRKRGVPPPSAERQEPRGRSRRHRPGRGRLGAVTVSTNMAGRGTDIVLGGLRHLPRRLAAGTRSRGGVWADCTSIGTEHHDARRIDNQLRGRAGRQGDPGSSQFYVSLEDELMQRFGGERIKSVMSWTGLEEDTPVENKLVTKSISGAQVKVEGYHFDIRKHLLEIRRTC